ncbi:E3 ubiquitin-ligase hrd-like protein 1 [Nymphaea thermarum]|nr:E3 ubiquitin-ligase hrd-like protein 1 [Nymphaea thermarum]
MLRTTVRSFTRSSMVAALEPRTGHHATASAMVHLHFQTRICSDIGGAEGGGEEGGSTETPAVHVLSLFTSSVIVTRSSLRTREEIMEHVRRHFSDHECGMLLGWADHVAVEMCYLILQPGNGRAALSPGEVQLVSLTTTITYHSEELQDDVDGDLEDPTEDMTEAQEEMDLADDLEELAADDLEELAADDALFAYEAVAAPASKAEENGQNTCVVCQDEVGRGDCLVRMPCSHEFHEGCILAWLRGACPVCRHELPTEDY